MTQENIHTSISGNGNDEIFCIEDIAPFWLSALIDSADDAIISKTLDGIVASWNKGAERIFGYTADEIIGRSILLLIPPELQHEEPVILARIRSGQRIEHYETIRVRKDGGRLNISLTVSPIKKPDGQIVGVSKIARDITAIKVAEEKLRKSEKQLRLITDAIPVLISYVDLEHRYRFVNRAYTDWFRIAHEELIGKHIRDVIGENAYETILPNMERVLAGERFDFEQLMPYPDGEKIIFVNYIPDIDEAAGHAKGFFALVQDVTEIKKAGLEREALLRREQTARQQAEEASRLKDEFLATVSHEIRTPLNAILGWSQMLISDKINQKDVPNAIETIYRNAKSQAQLIEDILDVSRIITGKIRLEAGLISVAPVIQMAVESLRPAIEAKNIRLQMRLDFEPRMVNADPNRLQQVIWNLLSNAIKFTPEGGSVEIRLETDAARTKIIVSDSGKGINPEFLPFVFERFRQADGSSTRKHGGLGLGLAIVRHIVELHGGTVSAASPGEDRGTTFTVYLSHAEADNLKKDVGENSPPPGTDFAENSFDDSQIKGLRVLLVDDEIDSLELLGVILQQSGAEFKAVNSVAKALETIKQWLPDMIVSDIAMPVEDGYALIRKLRSMPPEEGGTIPAIALTAYVGIKERTQVLSSGFQLYVPKPVEPAELVAALASLKS